MQLQIACRKQQTLKLALYGPAGSGKTYTSLLLAYGLCNDWNKIVLIDTEDASASLYAHLGPFTTIELAAPFHPSNLYEAVDVAEDSDAAVIIVDSLSQEWAGEGGVDDPLNETDKRELLQDHRCLLSLLSSCTAHVICTMHERGALINNLNASVGHLERITAPVQESGIEYRFTTVLRLDGQNKAFSVKDRTGVFHGKEPQALSSDHGQLLSAWCKSGEPAVPRELQERINACKTVKELHLLVAREDLEDMQLISAFTKRRLEIEQQGEQTGDDRISLSIA